MPHFLSVSPIFLSSHKTPDEEEIKRLKGYVVACGIRKQWCVEIKPRLVQMWLNQNYISRKKEFEGVEDKPKKQIARLKEILAGLGMTGRLSLDKAKAIREKRELATELGVSLFFYYGALPRLTVHLKRKSLRLKLSVAHAMRKSRRSVPKRQKSRKKKKRKNPISPKKSKKPQRVSRGRRRRLVSGHHMSLNMTYCSLQNILAFLKDQSDEDE